MKSDAYEEANKLLAKHGWTLECWSPFEIRHEDTSSFATGQAAQLILDTLRRNKRKKKKKGK